MMRQAARALLRRDLQLLWVRRGDALQPALFALLTVVLFALGLGGEAESLAPVASAVLWLAVMLAGLLALDSLFRGDAEDGSLEQWMLAPVPLWWLVLVRTLVHWLTTALPVIVAVPLLGELLHLPRAQLPVLMASLLLGTPRWACAAPGCWSPCWRCRCTCRCWCSARARWQPRRRAWMRWGPCCCSPPGW